MISGKDVVNVGQGVSGELPEHALLLRILLVGLLILTAAIPFLCCAWYETHDGLTYAVRAAEWSYQFQSDGVYPRWASNFYWGFGYPVFNYFPPLAYFLGHLVMLSGLTAPAAIRCIELAAFPLAFFGLFRLCRLYVDSQSAFVASVAGMLVPYRLVDVYVRGDLAESLAFALFPFVLAEAVLCSRRSHIRDGFRLAVSLALVFYAHTLTSFMCSIALAVFGLYQLRFRRWGGFFRIGGWSAVGLCLSAASWSPAVIERKYVNVNVATHAREFYSYFWGDHFLEWWQRFDPSFGFGPSVAGPADQMNFMISFVILGALIWAIISLKTPEGRSRYGVLLAAFAAVQLMMLGISRPLWAHVPFFPFFQFPWRFLILDSILGTLVLAKVLEELSPGRWQTLYLAPVMATGVGIAAVIFKTPWTGLSGTPAVWLGAIAAVAAVLTVVRYKGLDRWALLALWAITVPVMASVVGHAQKTEFPSAVIWHNPSFTDPVIREQTTLRRRDGVMEPLQTTGTNEFLPLTADPPPIEAMRAVVQFEGQLEGAAYKLVERTGTRRMWEVVTPSTQMVLLPIFFFPGMSVELNSQAVAPLPGKYGLLRVSVPPGLNQVAVHYDGTAVQHLSELVSLVSVILLAGLWVLVRIRERVQGEVDGSSQGVAGK